MTTTVPRAPGAVPLLGHSLRLIRPRRFLASLPASGDLVAIRLGTATVFVPCTPELVHQVLVDDRTFDKGGPVYDEVRRALGNGLAMCPHAGHRQRRRLVGPAFHHTRFPAYTDLLARQIDAAVAAWPSGTAFDVPTAAMRLAVSLSLLTLFSVTDADERAEGLHDDLLTFVGGWMRRMLTPAVVRGVAGGRRFQRARHSVDRLITDLIARCRNGTGNADGDGRADTFSSVIIGARDEHGHGLTEPELRDEFTTMFVVSVEITASSLGWLLHVLSRDTAVGDRVRAECHQIFGDDTPHWRHLEQVDYTRRVITETLRLYPPSWLLTRVTSTTTTLGGHRLPAGAIVLFSPFVVGRNPAVFTNPDQFDPDRWLPERAATLPRDAFTAFGAGARKCVGDTFATTILTLTARSVLRHWNLQAVAARRVRPRVAAALTPSRLRLRLTPATTPARSSPVPPPPTASNT